MEPETIVIGMLSKMDFNQFSSIFIKLFVVFMVTTMVKQFLARCFNYFMVRIDTLGIGSTVEYDGNLARISEITFSKIILETKDKFIYVSIDDWRKIDLFIPKKSDF